LSLLLPLRVVLAAGGGGAAAASWRRVGESVLALPGWRSVGSAAWRRARRCLALSGSAGCLLGGMRAWSW